MPLIEFSKPIEKFEPLRLLFASEVFACMLWPSDAEARTKGVSQIFGALNTDFATPRPQTVGPTPSPPITPLTTRLEQFGQDPAGFILGVTEQPWISDLLACSSPLRSACVSTAAVALTILGLKSHDPNSRIASVSKAAKYLSLLGGVSRDKQVMLPKHDKDIVDKWGTLNPAAHFWAAYALMVQGRKHFNIASRKLKTFFGLARAIGQQLQPELRDVDLWMLPDALITPAFDVTVSFDRIKIQNYLRDYKNDRDNGARLVPAGDTPLKDSPPVVA